MAEKPFRKISQSDEAERYLHLSGPEASKREESGLTPVTAPRSLVGEFKEENHRKFMKICEEVAPIFPTFGLPISTHHLISLDCFSTKHRTPLFRAHVLRTYTRVLYSQD